MEDGIYTLFGAVVAAVCAVLIAKDANTRGMSGLGWGIFTFLICIVAIPLYLIVRKPVKEAPSEA